MLYLEMSEIMKKKVLIGVIIIGLGILIGFDYGIFIIPRLVNYPLMHDIASDYVGARALINHNKELYPVLKDAFQEIGINWNADHRSTHPPTAYLLVVPLTFLNYPTAQFVWMAAMFVCIVLTYRVLSLNWGMALLAGLLSLAWPPGIWSLGQLTPIWLLGLALAYRYRGQPLISGVSIAIASLPKLLPAPSLLYHLWRKKWSVLIGFVTVWVVALAAVLFLRPDAISAFFNSNSTNSLEQILRTDNSALVVAAWRVGGWFGIVLVAAFVLYVLWKGLGTNGPYGWACLVWISIALLPIAWIYSLFPLLPWLGITIRTSTPVPRLLAIVSFLLPFFAPIPTIMPWAVSLSVVLSGLSFALAAVDQKYKDNRSHVIS